MALGWHWAFVVSGALGLLWLLLWLVVYHPLDRHPRVTLEEVRLVRAGQDAPASMRAPWKGKLALLAKDRNVWAIVLGRALTDPIGWFYVFWLPQYLSDVRGFNLAHIAMFAWLPFAAADLGNFIGGWASGSCIRKGLSVVHARLVVCAASCLPVLAGVPAAHVHSSYLALGLICVAMWGFASWSTMGLTLPSDLVSQDVVATVTGLSGLVAGLFGAGLTFMVGILADRSSYGPAFLVVGTLPIVATACLFVLIRPASRAFVTA
jgi:ACS family hexuronate transporter-like MFS transporter